MKSYKVSLHRDYIVTIEANSEEETLCFTEYFIACERDIATIKEREQYNFIIREIEMVTNDALEVEETK